MEDKINVLFKKFDINKDGFLDKKEVNQLLLSVAEVMKKKGKKFEVNQNKLDKLFLLADKNQDNLISKNEMHILLKNLK